MPTYSENLRTETEPLEKALNKARRLTKQIYHKRAECCLPDWEGEWDRVQRMRREGHPLMKGGQYRDSLYSRFEYL